MGATADCETVGAGFLGQPVNTLTTLAFVVAGVVVIGLRPDRRWVGIGLVATGVGSFLFHGPMPPGSEWAHDVTLAWLIALVAGIGSRWERLTHLPTLLVMAVFFAIVPVVTDPVAIVIAAAATLTILKRDRSRPVLASLLLLAAVAVYGRLGATGGPLCDPSSVLQPHGFWHVGSAIAGAWLAVAYSGSAPTAPRQADSPLK